MKSTCTNPLFHPIPTHSQYPPHSHPHNRVWQTHKLLLCAVVHALYYVYICLLLTLDLPYVQRTSLASIPDMSLIHVTGLGKSGDRSIVTFTSVYGFLMFEPGRVTEGMKDDALLTRALACPDPVQRSRSGTLLVAWGRYSERERSADRVRRMRTTPPII